MQPYVLVRLKRPEGYEDVHPELLLEDVGIHAVFEPELVSDEGFVYELSQSLSDLHSAIMNLPCHHNRDSSDAYSKGYAWGHRDARHAAAELATPAQARITELEEALNDLLDLVQWLVSPHSPAMVRARAALKEPT